MAISDSITNKLITLKGLINYRYYIYYQADKTIVPTRIFSELHNEKLKRLSIGIIKDSTGKTTHPVSQEAIGKFVQEFQRLNQGVKIIKSEILKIASEPKKEEPKKQEIKPDVLPPKEGSKEIRPDVLPPKNNTGLVLGGIGIALIGYFFFSKK